MHDTFGRNPLLFACRHERPHGTDAFPAKLRGWRDTLAEGGMRIVTRENDAIIEGVVMPVTPDQLQQADRENAVAGLKRAIAMVEIEGGRTWAFVYTIAA